MKLHLPKLLFTALITAAGIAQAKVTSIPLHTGSDNLPSVESNFYTFDTTDVELNTGDKLGAFGDNGNQLSLGQCTYDNKNGQTSSKTKKQIKDKITNVRNKTRANTTNSADIKSIIREYYE